MATIVEGKGKKYVFTFSQSETEWILIIAKSLGMTKETVMGASMYEGLCHYVTMLREIDEHDKTESHAEGKHKLDTGYTHPKD